MRIVLNEVAISYSRGSSRPRDQTWASLTLAGGFFTTEPLKIFGWPKSLFRFFIAWYGETWMNLLANLIVISICDPSKFLWVRNLREAYLGDCSQTLSWGCTHLKACLGLDDLFPRWLTDNTTGQPVLDVGERSEFLPTRPFHSLHDCAGMWPLGSLRLSDASKKVRVRWLLLYDLASEITYDHFYHIHMTGSKSLISSHIQ